MENIPSIWVNMMGIFLLIALLDVKKSESYVFMNKWLLNTELHVDTFSLVPMTSKHSDAITKATSDGELWKLWYTGVPSPNSVNKYIEFALSEKEANRALAFVVLDKELGKIIGSTRYLNAVPRHRRLEIGNTWYSASFQRTRVNTECKLLILSHTFE